MNSYRSRTISAVRFAVVGSLLGGLLACAGQHAVEPPRDLEGFEARYQVVRAWEAQLGGRDARGRIGLRPAADGERVYIAGDNGRVQARRARDGSRIWETRIGSASAGPALQEGVLAIGTVDGRLVILRASDGSLEWEQRLGSEVLAAPAISRGVVVVRTTDGMVRGFATDDGTELWSFREEVPALTLRGNATPIIRGRDVLIGFDSGRVMALSLEEGQSRWSATLGVGAGRTELEQLADVAPYMSASSNEVFAASADGRLAAYRIRTGDEIWAREIGSHAGLTADGDLVYVIDLTSDIHAVTSHDGAAVWQQDVLRGRQLTAPERFRDTLVVGDLDGYVHFLDADDGEIVARRRVWRSAINTPPLAVDDVLVVQDGRGRVIGYRLRPTRP
jgi:outer membrane protein assembly factor BamB